MKLTFPSNRITGTTNLDQHLANLAFMNKSRSWDASLVLQNKLIINCRQSNHALAVS